MKFRTGALVRLATWLTVALCTLFFSPMRAAAQYFGQNKVQYETFDFHVMHTPHFNIYFYPAESLAVHDAARMAERWYTRHSAEFNYQLSDRKAIVLYANQPDFQQTNVVGGQLTENTGGVTVTAGVRDRVVLPLTGSYFDNNHVLGHELVHVFQYDIAMNPSLSKGGLQRVGQLPGWLIEGMAEYLSLGRHDPLTAMFMRDAALYNNVPSIHDLTYTNKYFPYRYGEALWAYIGGRWGDAAVTDVYRAALQVGWNNALIRVLGVPSDTLSKEWAESTRETYLPTVAGRTAPNFAGERVLAEEEKAGTMNIAPAVSPDGQYVAFFSSRSLFSTELYLADAHTGKIIKQLTHPSINSHFNALAWEYTAGTWSPDGKRFAFITYADGNNEIELLDIASGNITKHIRPQNVGAVMTMAWSPDGNQIAFSGIKGGVSDLFLYNLKTGATKELTHDRYADLLPAWSPDGKTIAFATDRGTNFDSLTFSPLQLGLMDVASGTVKVVPTFPDAKAINPQFSPDGRSIYFIANPGGFSDIYRVDLASGQLYQVTRVATGVAGIAATSPAISVASKSGRLLFSVFEKDGYRVYGLSSDKAQGTPVTTAQVATSLAGVLPPWNALKTSAVLQRLQDPMGGLPPQSADYTITPYHASLGLEYIGSQGAGVQVGGPFGTGAIGGIAAEFDDILGNRTLGMQLGVQGSIKNTAGQLYYLNSKHRWNWSLSGSHIPYLSGFQDAYQNQNGIVFRQILFREYDDQLGIGTQYPFSETRRFEINASIRHIGYGTEVDSILTDLNGFPLDEGQGSAPSPPGLVLAQVGAALVGDNSIFALTGPIKGTRYRFEVDPTFGNLTFMTALADFRHYMYLRPLTFAFRGFQYGRYGKDAQSDRFFPLYVGDPYLIRGYNVTNFDPGECTRRGPADSANSCPVFDRLLGSRMAVLNFELRIPFVGPDVLGSLIHSNFLPIDLVPFFDAGMAWNKGEFPNIEFSTNSTGRIPVFSTGLAARINVLGYTVVELYYAHPFQRPDKNWVFGFQLQPGW
ncbi:MAG TPA: BamA/TamA family outer membrane protein [Gemmatimonadaceae bacterium]|nr:BamA/TamA family outer membrane protein [Gemmatimonadaceae bacterium]